MVKTCTCVLQEKHCPQRARCDPLVGPLLQDEECVSKSLNRLVPSVSPSALLGRLDCNDSSQAKRDLFGYGRRARPHDDWSGILVRFHAAGRRTDPYGDDVSPVAATINDWTLALYSLFSLAWKKASFRSERAATKPLRAKTCENRAMHVCALTSMRHPPRCSPDIKAGRRRKKKRPQPSRNFWQLCFYEGVIPQPASWRRRSM